MSAEHDNIAAPDGDSTRPPQGPPQGQPPLMINGMPVIGAAPPPPLGERLKSLRSDFRSFKAYCPDNFPVMSSTNCTRDCPPSPILLFKGLHFAP